jgi:predicted  nucleic acid-binding Zn-ribbon protein
MQKLGVKEEEFESFILDTYNRCINLELSSENIAFHIKDLLEFLKTNSSNNNSSNYNSNSNSVIPLSQISQFIQQKADEKKKLEEKIKSLESQIKILNEQKAISERSRDSALHDEHTTAAELKYHYDLKIELGRYGIPIYDIPKFAKIWSGLAQKGYDIDKIILEFSDLEAARSDYMFYQERIPSLKMQKDELEESTKFYKQRLSYVEDLQAIGFGLKELKALWYTIVEISNTNNISREDAVKRLLKEIEDHYDDILGLESRKHELDVEVNDLHRLKLNLSGYLKAFTNFGGPIAKFVNIINNNSPEEVSLLVDKVYMVGGIRTAIEKLSDRPILVTDGKSPFLSNISDNDSHTETSAIRKFSDRSITSQANSGIHEHDKNKNNTNHQQREEIDENIRFPKKTSLLQFKQLNGPMIIGRTLTSIWHLPHYMSYGDYYYLFYHYY